MVFLFHPLAFGLRSWALRVFPWHILEYTLPCLFNCMIQPFLDILTANPCKLDQTFERNAVMCWKADGTGPMFSREVKHTSIPAWVHSKLWVLVLNCWCKKISAVAWNNRIILSSYSHYLLKKSDIWTCLKVKSNQRL